MLKIKILKAIQVLHPKKKSEKQPKFTQIHLEQPKKSENRNKCQTKKKKSIPLLQNNVALEQSWQKKKNNWAAGGSPARAGLTGEWPSSAMTRAAWSAGLVSGSRASQCRCSNNVCKLFCMITSFRKRQMLQSIATKGITGYLFRWSLPLSSSIQSHTLRV